MISCKESPATIVNISSALDTARKECGYELKDIEKIILTAQTETINADGIQQTYVLDWSKAEKNFRAQLILDCAPSDSSMPDSDASSPVLTPRELISSEDSGGRYMRNVAWQRSVTAKNWTAHVAYIDYIFGDGQRTDTRDFLACNIEIAMPCIKMSVIEPSSMDDDDIASIMSIFMKISTTK